MALLGHYLLMIEIDDESTPPARGIQLLCPRFILMFHLRLEIVYVCVHSSFRSAFKHPTHDYYILACVHAYLL